jgi:hypothetical protein
MKYTASFPNILSLPSDNPDFIRLHLYDIKAGMGHD